MASRAGKFELASGGTLLLDEIGEMSLGGQAKLLRVLEEKIVVRVGGSTPIRTDVRVIAATNQNLAELVRQKRFREDLYFRLNVVTLTLPSLRERGEDVLVLAEHFLQQFGEKIGRRAMSLSKRAMERLRAHAWPGNVRELRNMMERVAYLAANPVVEESDLGVYLSADAIGRSQDLARLDDAKRCDGTLSIRVHPAACRSRGWQHRPRGSAPRLASIEPLPQDAATGHGNRRVADLCTASLGSSGGLLVHARPYFGELSDSKRLKSLCN